MFYFLCTASASNFCFQGGHSFFRFRCTRWECSELFCFCRSLKTVSSILDHSSSVEEELNETGEDHESLVDHLCSLAAPADSLQLPHTRSSSTSPERTPAPSSPVSLLTPTPAVTVSDSFSCTSAANPSSPASHRKRVKFSQPLPRKQSSTRDHSDWHKNPAFIFLQLYHSPYLRLGGRVQDLPILLPSTEVWFIWLSPS